MSSILYPGNDICEADGFIKGHGTEIKSNHIVSTYYGNVKQINKLITVIPLVSSRYTPEVGDVIIGRVTQIFNKRWRLETNSKNDTTLSLSAINLPGVMQRRKSEEDEMNMHSFFAVKDLLVCEVQKVSQNGNASLHTRNEKYGKLSNGTLIIIPHILLTPMRSRFLQKHGIEIIVGCNGYIWARIINNTENSYLCLSKLLKSIQDMAQKREAIDVNLVLDNIAI